MRASKRPAPFSWVSDAAPVCKAEQSPDVRIASRCAGLGHTGAGDLGMGLAPWIELAPQQRADRIAFRRDIQEP